MTESPYAMRAPAARVPPVVVLGPTTTGVAAPARVVVTAGVGVAAVVVAVATASTEPAGSVPVAAIAGRAWWPGRQRSPG